MSANARIAASTAPRPTAPRASKSRTSAADRTLLAVVATPQAKHGRSAFVAVVAALLVVGLAALLALNTLLAQEAFVLSSLQQRSAALGVTEQALATRLSVQETPSQLAARARALGMRPSGPPLFLSLSDGRVLGAGAKAKVR